MSGVALRLLVGRGVRKTARVCPAAGHARAEWWRHDSNGADGLFGDGGGDDDGDGGSDDDDGERRGAGSDLGCAQWWRAHRKPAVEALLESSGDAQVRNARGGGGSIAR